MNGTLADRVTSIESGIAPSLRMALTFAAQSSQRAAF